MMPRLDAILLRAGGLVTIAYAAAILYINFELKAAEPWVVDALWGISWVVTLAVFGPVRARRDEGATASLVIFLLLGPLGPILLLIPILTGAILSIDEAAIARAGGSPAAPRRRGRDGDGTDARSGS